MATPFWVLGDNEEIDARMSRGPLDCVGTWYQDVSAHVHCIVHDNLNNNCLVN